MKILRQHTCMEFNKRRHFNLNCLSKSNILGTVGMSFDLFYLCENIIEYEHVA